MISSITVLSGGPPGIESSIGAGPGTPEASAVRVPPAICSAKPGKPLKSISLSAMVSSAKTASPEIASATSGGKSLKSISGRKLPK